jgi:hypothetical protein
MKKSESSKKDKTKKLSRNKIIAVVACLVTVLFAGFVGVYGYFYYQGYVKATIDQAPIEPIRELVTMAIDNLHSDSVIDPKTGDVYFPPSTLFIPYEETMPRNIVYSYAKAFEGTPDELTITQKGLGVVQSQAYAAKNVEEFLNTVPKIQACQRGIRVYYQQPSDKPELQLRETITLNNGKTIYAYTEDSCPEVDILLPYIKNIQEF